MSWKEAQEAFEKTETVILPVGTLHGHGPTPISVDSSSVEWLAEEVGKRTGIMTLPLLPYGENDKQKYYPGSITVEPDTLKRLYLDIFKSLRRFGVKKVVVLNGHGGNRETLIRAGRAARDFGVLIAMPEWWNIGRQITPELFREKGAYMSELAVSLVIGGKDIADFRSGGYMGEWGHPYTQRNLLGDDLPPTGGFNTFEYKGGTIIIPVQAWDTDVDGPPEMGEEVVEELHERGTNILAALVDYLVDFVKKYDEIDVSEALKTVDNF
jgi:creatinine amidohydrolase